MKFYSNLYVSPDIKRPAVMKWRLKHNAGNLALYVITLSGNTKETIPGGNQLELMHCANLHQPYYKKQKDLLIVGMAGNYMAGVELVRKMTEDCYNETGKADLKSYLFGELGESITAEARRKENNE